MFKKSLHNINSIFVLETLTCHVKPSFKQIPAFFSEIDEVVRGCEMRSPPREASMDMTAPRAANGQHLTNPEINEFSAA